MTRELEHSLIRVDENADWFYEGSRIFRPEILESFYEKLELLPSGEYVLAEATVRCLLEVADTPFVITRVDVEGDASGGERIVLGLKNLPGSERLDPGTLRSGKDNVLYCRIRNGRFPARFSRPAYYQFAAFIGEDESGLGFFFQLNGERHPIQMDGTT